MDMLTSLDWLVIAFMGFAAAALLSLCLMFLLRNQTARRVCVYVVSALALCLGGIGILIGGVMFPEQSAAGVIAILMGIGAVVLERLSRGGEKMLLYSRLLAAAALILGFASAALI